MMVQSMADHEPGRTEILASRGVLNECKQGGSQEGWCDGGRDVGDVGING
jgi:hypothetical protein